MENIKFECRYYDARYAENCAHPDNVIYVCSSVNCPILSDAQSAKLAGFWGAVSTLLSTTSASEAAAYVWNSCGPQGTLKCMRDALTDLTEDRARELLAQVGDRDKRIAELERALHAARQAHAQLCDSLGYESDGITWGALARNVGARIDSLSADLARSQAYADNLLNERETEIRLMEPLDGELESAVRTVYEHAVLYWEAAAVDAAHLIAEKLGAL